MKFAVIRPRLSPLAGGLIAMLPLAFGLLAGPRLALAERADRDRPLQIEADRMDYDDAQKVNVFNGRVSLSKGSLLIRADRVVLREDREGNQNAVATGRPATLRQRRDGSPDSWVEGQGERIEWDSRTDLAIFSQAAQLRRLEGPRVIDDVQGGRIRYNTRSETYEVDGSVAASSGEPASGRVRVTIQPRTAPK